MCPVSDDIGSRREKVRPPGLVEGDDGEEDERDDWTGRHDEQVHWKNRKSHHRTRVCIGSILPILSKNFNLCFKI